MKIGMKIDYSWKCDTLKEIPILHEEVLKESAEERIFEMIKEGYRMGDLSTYVRFGKDVVHEEDEEDGLSYSGWWSLTFPAK